MTYRNAKGQFTTKYDFERTYGTLSEGVSVDLNDPEVRQAIKDISGESHPFPYKEIHNAFYVIWVVGSAFAIGVAFFLGTLAYR